ncbi:hypothetical protein KRX19_11350 [Cardiobacteriaceae bacterium TAE3-ERU3]|nr:hypothetical protein [Cardiobacteriaceae bacterium TAE3-ERU3]
MKSIISARASRPFSWGAVFAGVVVGAVASMAILAIGAFITFLFGLSFSLTGFMGLFWFALSAIVGAFVAGNVAVNAQAPARDDNFAYQVVSKAHATLTGGVTAALLVLFTTFFTVSSIGAIVGTTANAVGGAIGNAVGGAAQTAAIAGSNSDFSMDDLPNVKNALGNVSEEDIAKFVANNNDELNEEQIQAIAGVVKSTIEQSKEQVSKDFKNKEITLDNAQEYVKTRYEAVKNQLTDDELITRLQREGLTRAEAVDVQQYLVKQANEIEKEAEQAVAKAKQAVEEAEAAARSAARWAALSWLISAFLTFMATLAGAHSAAGRIRD